MDKKANPDYSPNPLDDMDLDEDDEEYFFDIPSDAF